MHKANLGEVIGVMNVFTSVCIVPSSGNFGFLLAVLCFHNVIESSFA